MERNGNVLSGLDVLVREEIDSLKGLRVGIMCNHAAVTRDLIGSGPWLPRHDCT